MRLNNHIALRFLTDDTLAFEVIETTHFKKVMNILNRHHLENVMNQKCKNLWELVNKDNQKSFLVTETVHDKLDMLKVKRNEYDHYDWTVFSDVATCKWTFILYPTEQWDGGGCLRIKIDKDMIEFCHIGFKFDEGGYRKEIIRKGKGQALWTLFYINRFNNDHGSHCDHQNVKDIYEFVYKLLCFVFLSENEYEVVKPGHSSGTKKKDKFKNDLPIPVTIINSKWNITVIRTDEFTVSGHFALRRCGVGRTQTRMVYIEPFIKHGYVRRAASIGER